MGRRAAPEAGLGAPVSFVSVLADAIEEQDDPSAVLAALVHELARRGTLPAEIRIAGPWESLRLSHTTAWIRVRRLSPPGAKSAYAAQAAPVGPVWHWQAAGQTGDAPTAEEALAAADTALDAAGWVSLNG